MTIIHISPQLADKLNRLAEREQKTVDEMAQEAAASRANADAADKGKMTKH